MSDTNVYKEYTPPETGGLYFKFEEGVESLIRILSEPVVFESLFKDKDTKEETVSTKYAWLIYNFSLQSIQILQLPVTAYKEVAKFGADDEYGDPKEYNMKIKRTGKSRDTKYSIIASPKKYDLVGTEGYDPDHGINIIEKLQAGENVGQVNWLHEVIGKPRQAAAPAPVVQDVTPTDDEVDDAPIDLSQIPF